MIEAGTTGAVVVVVVVGGSVVVVVVVVVVVGGTVVVVAATVVVVTGASVVVVDTAVVEVVDELVVTGTVVVGELLDVVDELDDDVDVELTVNTVVAGAFGTDVVSGEFELVATVVTGADVTTTGSGIKSVTVFVPEGHLVLRQLTARVRELTHAAR